MGVKIDLKKELKQFYRAQAGKPQMVTLPAFNYLMIDGQGHTESRQFSLAIQALFGVSYKAKFIMKKTRDFDYVVMPLEGLWWADDMRKFVSGDKDEWQWTLMIMQPDGMDQEILNRAIAETEKKVDISILSRLRLEKLHEGKAIQLLHIGAYSEEHANIMKIHDHINHIGGTFDGNY